MNKKLEDYKNKAIKINNTIKLILISVFILGLMISIVRYTIKNIESDNKNQNIANETLDYVVDIEEEKVIYTETYSFNVDIKNYDKNYMYKLSVKINNEEYIEKQMNDSNNNISIILKDEGVNEINLVIYKNTEENYNKKYTIYYVKPYQSQYLDEFSNIGCNMKIDNLKDNEKEDAILLINAAGIKNLRIGIWWKSVYMDNSYEFEKYDKWLNEINNNGINIMAILGFPGNLTRK